MKTYAIDNIHHIKDPVLFLKRARVLLVDKIREYLNEQNIKGNLVFLVEYKKSTDNQPIFQKMNFKTKNTIILPTTDITHYIKSQEQIILAEMEDFQTKESGWALHKILHLEVRINRYIPLRGSSYLDLPDKIKAKRATVNIQNTDEKCFLWAILAALHPNELRKHPERIHHYKQNEHQLDKYLDGISFPVSLDHVKLFQQRSNISVNVYSYDDKLTIYPLLITDEEKEKHVDLLYMKNKNTTHYCLIRSLSRLVRSQITKCHGKTWLCKRCLMHYGSEDLLNKHKTYCNEHELVRPVMPKEGSVIEFKDFYSSMRVPFAAYADFECMLTPVHSCQPFLSSYTEKYQKHEPVSFSYYIVYADGEYQQPVNYFGTDAAQVFVLKLLEESKRIKRLYSSEAIKPMELTPADLQTISNAQNCHVCGKTLEEDQLVVKDHDHLTGRFRGMAHNACNLNYNKPQFIPIFMHNLSGYDTHLFIKMFGLSNETIQVIPNNEEKYISYTIKVEGGVNLRFLDSLRFMASSIDSLVKNLSQDQFKHTSKYYSGEKFQLLLRKGVYPYDYMDSMDKFECISLPEKHHFYNKLNKTGIDEEDYHHAMNVWDVFNISNMKEYTMLYNQTDVLLLADIMENFRDVCLNTYELDPAWYYTAPGLSWNAMLKTTAVKLELLTDYDMILLIGEGIRGGVSQCSNRYAKANNPYTEQFDSTKQINYLTYLDANNLYGWAMSQHMPYADFNWVKDINIDITTVPDDAETGYILEVDLEYPKELHDVHLDLPVAPERKVPPGSKEKKLLTTLFDKKQYIVHYRNLKLYISLGLKLKKIHRMISFTQKDWLKPYIDLNTQMRTRAGNDFEKDFYKLMINSVFGKTMENIRNRVDIRLATQNKQVDKWIANPNFKHRTIFTENLAAVHMRKTKLLFNKPSYVGFSILDVSKILIYDFHYNVIKKRYGDKAQLQYTDTDSLTYLIETCNLYDDIKQMIDLFDTSDYPTANRWDMPKVNKKVLGKMKDELKGRIMYEHVGLRSKMYASRSENLTQDGDDEIKKSKGVKKSVVDKEITFKDYKECLLNKEERYGSMNMIRSYKHDLYSVELNKIVLSAKDDKRYILEDGVKSIPWGHYSISQFQSE